MKKFAAFDIDGTLFRWQLFSEVVFELIESGHIPISAKKDVDEKMAAWRQRTHRHSFNDYEMAIVNAFVPHLANIKVKDLEAAADVVMERSGAHVYAYTRDLIKTLKQKGYTLIAISGSQNEIVQRFAKLWEFDIAIGQAFDNKDDYYTGKIVGDKLLVFTKDVRLKEIVAREGLSWKDSIAMGDSKSDAGMLAAVEHPIAFNPNDELFEIAKEKGWKIVIERKNMIYELESKDGTYLLEAADTR